MVNKERMVNEFIELVEIDSLSYKERDMADRLKNKLTAIGYDVYEDDAGKKVGGNTGNLICKIKGNKDVPAIMLVAHMDTVVPGIGKKAVIKGDVIVSGGATVLGADDISGIECILEVVRVLKEKNISHGDIYAVFTIAEEKGLIGAKNLDYEKIDAKYGFVLDVGGKSGNVAIRQPIKHATTITVLGKAAHAGSRPEEGINAIQIASKAIAGMKLGRIDSETTANIGIIRGGEASNIVCDRVDIKAEARSLNKEKLETQINHMKECFLSAAKEYGGSMEFESKQTSPGFSMDENDEIIKILKKTAELTNFNLNLISTGGVSDTCILNSKGIQAVNICSGAGKSHALDEFVSINDMVKTANFLLALIEHGIS
ncbi:MAG TPA: M20/M25/M40 family metallo-hydrolase [Clostridiales bacterium]|nr:M20/M25/M40 family metallo-hydrolase [Clostridiales bacterium]